MNQKEPFKYVGLIPNFDKLLNKVLTFNETNWSHYKERKNTGRVASYHIDAIPLKYSANLLTYTEDKKSEYYEEFESYILDLCQMVSDCVGPVSEKRSILTRMKPKQVIKPHRDSGPILTTTHRVHLPIITNSLCVFTVGEVSMNLKPGEIWIIDNTDRIHSVENYGSTDRVHLLVDAG